MVWTQSGEWGPWAQSLRWKIVQWRGDFAQATSSPLISLCHFFSLRIQTFWPRVLHSQCLALLVKVDGRNISHGLWQWKPVFFPWLVGWWERN
jgi:hypothetical protein